MSTASRPPLSTSRRGNVSEKAQDSAKDADHKLKKALASLAEERRRRAEVEGVVDALRREKEVAAQSSSAAQQELSLAQSEIRAQKATIMRLSAAAASSSAATTTHAEFEVKLQDLIGKHNQSKAKHQAELLDSQTSNLSLQSVITSLQATSATDRQTITDLRCERAVLRKELELLRARPPPPAREGKTDDLGRFKEERRAWREEKMALEGEVKVLTKQRQDTARLAAQIEELERGKVTLEALLRDTAAASAALCRDRVPSKDYVGLREELIMEKSARWIMERKWRESRQACRILTEENSVLKERIRETGEDRDAIAADLSYLLHERRLDLATTNTLPPPFYFSLEPLDNGSDILALLDLALNHITLLTSHTTSTSTSHLSTISALSHDLTHAQSSLSTVRASLSTLQTTHTSTSAELEAMLSAHSDCAVQIMDWRAEANRATAQEARLKSELCDVTRKLERLEETVKGEREMLKRANEGSARWGAARLALEDEVESLRLALADSRDLQERYDTIVEEVDILRSREAMASEEAERLGMQNAELIGHGNGGQKISYVEGLRREMALVKHELATTRHHLNAASTQIAELTSEIEAYKSIAPSLLASTTGGTGRIRVARRQPEGGEVLGGSLARRSVSTSTAASQGRF